MQADALRTVMGELLLKQEELTTRVPTRPISEQGMFTKATIYLNARDRQYTLELEVGNGAMTEELKAMIARIRAVKHPELFLFLAPIEVRRTPPAAVEVLRYRATVS